MLPYCQNGIVSPGCQKGKTPSGGQQERGHGLTEGHGDSGLSNSHGLRAAIWSCVHATVCQKAMEIKQLFQTIIYSTALLLPLFYGAGNVKLLGLLLQIPVDIEVWFVSTLTSVSSYRKFDIKNHLNKWRVSRSCLTCFRILPDPPLGLA